MLEPNIKVIHNKELKKDFLLRNNEIDEQGYEDVFKHRFHVPDLNSIPYTVLDLGCNIGLTTEHYKSMWPHATIHAYDIDRENLFLANFNSPNTIKYLQAITTLQYPAYEKEGSPQAYKVVSKFITGERFYSVSGATLDEAISRLETKDGCVDFVKMDIEGEELNCFKSNGSWRHRIKNILVECHGVTDDDTYKKTDLIERILRYRGFNVKRHTIHWSALYAWKNF